jgi:transcriptional regulator with XRE-family HTH domain
MRRRMLGMSQKALGGKLCLTFQQVQKCEKNTNRIGASRPRAPSNILQVPVPFFFDGPPQIAGRAAMDADALPAAYVTDLLA